MVFPELKSITRASLISCGLLLGYTSFPNVAVAASENSGKKALEITVDRAKVVRIATAADTIIIGNPSIIDATIQDARTIVLTGRNFGITNLIVLDADGDAIVDETIVVKGHETNLVRIYRQSVRETLACSPVCEQTLSVGDDSKNFNRTSAQISVKNDLAERSAK